MREQRRRGAKSVRRSPRCARTRSRGGLPPSPLPPIRGESDRKYKGRSAIIHAGRARRVSSFFRTLNPIDPVKETITRGFCPYSRGVRGNGRDVRDQITHRNVLCRKLTLYFVSRMLVPFIIRGISTRCIALHMRRVQFVVHFDSRAPSVRCN